MFEKVIEFLSSPEIPVYAVLLTAFIAAFAENVFPPAPSDVLLLLLGAMVGLERIDFIPLLLISTLGSVTGFTVMFFIGRFLGSRVLSQGKFWFVTKERLQKPRKWFMKYGYTIIVVNRFLSGTRAVVSFFAGISHLRATKTILLCGISAMAWNALVIYIGKIFGSNWREANKFIELYGDVLLGVIALLVLGYIIRKIWKKVSNP